MNSNTSMKHVLKHPDDERWMEQVEKIISNHIDDRHLTVSRIAQGVYLSERQFYRRMKKETGKTPNQYLQHSRLEKAREMLETGSVGTVKELALSVGYTRSDYFSKLFELEYGRRPSDYLQDN